ncbi:MAG TPA: adenylate/guanylate cyclase domain-containing protein [Methylomirabilota bacterium]
MRRNALFWGIIGLALAIGVVATLDRYQRQGRTFAGFWVMENLLVAIGGPERGPLEPFDVVRVMNGQVLKSGGDIQTTIESQDPGTTFHYIVYRRGQLVEADVRTRLFARRDFLRFVTQALLPGLFQLAVGAVVFLIRPGRSQSWLFLTFSLIAYVVSITFADAHTTYRFSGLFLTAWAFWPATLLHLALTFPQRRRILRRFPRVIWLPYLISGALAALLQLPGVYQLPGLQGDVRLLLAVPAAGAAYWGVALILLVLSLARASVVGGTPLIQQRARILCAAFVLGYVPPILGTAVEALFHVPVPYLNAMWQLTLLFPIVMAYAMIRYDLFDVRAALRAGTVYSAATGLVVLAYTGAIAAMDILLANWEAAQSPIVAAAVMAVLVVVLLNPLYLRSQRLVDRLFFRQRVDVQRSIERVSEVMSGLLDLPRIVELLTQTVGEQLHPVQQELYLLDARRQGYVRANEEEMDEQGSRPPIDGGSPLVRCLELRGQPLTRWRVEEDPVLEEHRAGCLTAMDGLGASLVVPFLFQGRVTGLLALGPRRSGLGYSSQDLGLLRLLANSSALALEHARAYTALQETNAELRTVVRRVEILESIRSNLAKFVPRTVQDLIERAPEAPELDKREGDVTVLFVDLVGYTRLTERLDPGRVNELVERCFGAYLDEILRRGGDVNETAGDGLMAIFRDADPRRHARQAVKCGLAILRRTRELNDSLDGLPEPLAVHIGVNSGLATVGATKIEGANGTRWTYTASGQVTIVAARVAALARGNEILVGSGTRERLGDELSFEALGERPLRNVETPVRLFRLALPQSVPAPVTA